MAKTTKNISIGKNFTLPNLISNYKKTDNNTNQNNLDDSYFSTQEEKADVERVKKPTNYFGYEQKSAEEQQYHNRRINDLIL